MTPNEFAKIINDELCTSPSFNQLVEGCMVEKLSEDVSAIPVKLSDGTLIGITIEMVKK